MVTDAKAHCMTSGLSDSSIQDTKMRLLSLEASLVVKWYLLYRFGDFVETKWELYHWFQGG